MTRLKFFLPFTMFIISYGAIAQSLNQNWKEDLNKAITEFKQCKSTIEDNVNPCSKYTGQSLKLVYNIDDFFSKDLNRYLTGSEIVTFLESSSQWVKTGTAIDQEALNAAQKSANDKQATVAVFSDENGIGHVALILPGELTPSGSWARNVPNCASFFMHTPGKSFSGKPLSYAFSKNMVLKVTIYSRK